MPRGGWNEDPANLDDALQSAAKENPHLIKTLETLRDALRAQSRRAVLRLPPHAAEPLQENHELRQPIAELRQQLTQGPYAVRGSSRVARGVVAPAKTSSTFPGQAATEDQDQTPMPSPQRPAHSMMAMPAAGLDKAEPRPKDETPPPAVGVAGLHRDMHSASADLDSVAPNAPSASDILTPAESSSTSAGYTHMTQQAGEQAATPHAEGLAEEAAATDDVGDVGTLGESKRVGPDGQTPDRSSPGAKAAASSTPTPSKPSVASQPEEPEGRTPPSLSAQPDTEQRRTSTLQGGDATIQRSDVTTVSSSASESSLEGNSSAATAKQLSTPSASGNHATSVNKAPVLDDSDSSDIEEDMEMSLEQQRSFYSVWTA